MDETIGVVLLVVVVGALLLRFLKVFFVFVAIAVIVFGAGHLIHQAQDAGSSQGQTQSGDQTSGKEKVTKADSPVWKGLKPWRGKTKTNGETGRARRYYEWDNTHGDIEEYDSTGKHLGSLDPETGKQIKPPVKGRRIDL